MDAIWPPKWTVYHGSADDRPNDIRSVGRRFDLTSRDAASRTPPASADLWSRRARVVGGGAGIMDRLSWVKPAAPPGGELSRCEHRGGRGIAAPRQASGESRTAGPAHSRIPARNSRLPKGRY